MVTPRAELTKLAGTSAQVGPRPPLALFGAALLLHAAVVRTVAAARTITDSRAVMREMVRAGVGLPPRLSLIAVLTRRCRHRSATVRTRRAVEVSAVPAGRSGGGATRIYPLAW